MTVHISGGNTEVDLTSTYSRAYVHDNGILIPQYISRLAFYSATGFILPNCIVAYMFDYKCMFALFAMLYVSTMLHWNKIKQNGPIRTIDIILACTTLYRFTFIDRFRLCPIYQTFWLYVFYTMIMAFGINEYILYMQVLRGEPYAKDSLYKYKIYTRWPFQLLNYTPPNTKEREAAYYRSTYVHTFFLHVLPMATSGSFIILSYYQCPAPAPGA